MAHPAFLRNVDLGTSECRHALSLGIRRSVTSIVTNRVVAIALGDVADHAESLLAPLVL